MIAQTASQPIVHKPLQFETVLNYDGRNRGVNSSKFLDLSNNGRHGTISGAVWKSGNYGINYLEFDGIDDYVDTNYSGIDSAVNSFTAMIWFKGALPAYIMSQAHVLPPGAYATDWGFAVTNSVFWFRSKTLGALSLINNNKWHHITMVWDAVAKTYQGYVDAKYIGTSDVLVDPGAAVGASVIIGARGDKTSAFMGGSTSSCRIIKGKAVSSCIRDIFNKERIIYGV